MRVPSSNRDLALWKNLQNIRSTIGASEADLAAMSGMPIASFRRYQSGKKSLPVDAVFSLVDHLPLSFERVMNGDIDLEALHEHNRGNKQHIPNRYQEGSFSKRRTSINALYFIETHLGTVARNNLLKHLQVDRELFRDPDATINIHFITDVLNHLARYHHTKDSFIQIGKYSTDTNLKSRLAEVYRECRNPSEMYDKLFNVLVSNYDENYDYRLFKLTKTGARLRVYQKQRTEDALKLKTYGCVPICWMRLGINVALPRYKGLPEANVTKTKCIFSGHEYCEMEIDFEFSHYASLKQPASSRSH